KTEVTFGCRYIIDGKPALNFKETNPSYMPATILSAAIYPKALTPDEINKIKGVELIKLIAAQASSSEPGLYNGKTQTPDRLIEGPRTIPNFWNSNSKINDPTPWFWVKLERPAEVTSLVIQWKLADGQLGNRAMKYTVSTSMDGITFTDTGVNQDNVIGLTPNTARDLLPGWAGKTQYIKVNMSNCSYGQTPEYFTCYWVEIYGRPL
ncbi:MAG: type domain, partial [Acidobacteriota bacterium]|nr:type domain [Acidobacteriota bacterium]